MSDPQDLGLGELGQRVQALGDPVVEPRLRPYHGAASSGGSPANGHAAPAPSYETFEEFRVTQVHSHSTTGASTESSANPFPPKSPYSATAPSSSASQPYEGRSPWDRPSPDRASADRPAAEKPASTGPSSSAPSQGPAASSQPSAGSAAPADDPNAPKSGLMRALNAMKSALPLVQKLLPMLDGNFATAISALAVTPQQQPTRTPAPVQPPVVVDLEPIERGLAEVKNSHRELRIQFQENVATLKRVDDQLEHVREATDRNTLEQQELVEDLRSVGGRLNLFAIIGLVLLLGSLALNAYFLIQLQHILH